MPGLCLGPAVSPDVAGEGGKAWPRGPEPPMPGGGPWGVGWEGSWGVVRESPGPGGLLSGPVTGRGLMSFQGPARPSPPVTEPPPFPWPPGCSWCSSRSCDLVCPCLSFPSGGMTGGEGAVSARTQGVRAACGRCSGSPSRRPVLRHRLRPLDRPLRPLGSPVLPPAPLLPRCSCGPLPRVLKGHSQLGSEGLCTEAVRGRSAMLGEDSSVVGIFRNT